MIADRAIRMLRLGVTGAFASFDAMTTRALLCALLCVPSLLACAVTPSAVKTGADVEVTHDGLHRVEHSKRFQRVWVKPGARLDGYSKILTVDAGIHYTRDPKSTRDEFPLTETQLANLRDGLREAIEEELARDGRWSLVKQRGPDVLALRVALIDVFLTSPATGGGRDRSYGSSAGAATLVVEVFDSGSLEILARIADRRVAERDSSSWRNDTITNRRAAKQLFVKWARRLGDALEFAQSQGSLPTEE